MNSDDIIPLGALDDPIAMSWFFGIDHLYKGQQEDIRWILSGKTPYLSGVYCNSYGKTTHIIRPAGLAAMAIWPGTTVVSTSGSWNQIDTQLWPSVKAAVSRYPGWVWNKKELTAPVVEVDGIPLQSKWVPFSTNDPARAEGYHNQYVTGKSGQRILLRCIYIIDEAKGEHLDPIFDALARCKVWSKAVLSSPGEDHGAFYDSQHKYSSLWHTVQRPWTECPHLYGDSERRSEIEHEIQVKGRDHPLIKSQYFAEFFRGVGYNVFIDADKIRRAMGGTLPRFGHERRFAIDTSDGGDEQVFSVREGNTVVDFKVYHIKDMTVLGDMLFKDCKRWSLNADDGTVDNGGCGKSLIDYLEKKYGYRGIRRYMNDAHALDETIYANVYTEDCFEHLAEMLDYINLPNDDKLLLQMLDRKYILPNNDSNRRRLVPKEELRRHGIQSPDRLDTMIMLFSDMPHPENYKGFRKLTNWERYKKEQEDSDSGSWQVYGGMNCDR